jgi:hypothetical protein
MALFARRPARRRIFSVIAISLDHIITRTQLLDVTQVQQKLVFLAQES